MELEQRRKLAAEAAPQPWHVDPDGIANRYDDFIGSVPGPEAALIVAAVNSFDLATSLAEAARALFTARLRFAVHPDKETAEEGYAAEDALREALDAFLGQPEDA